MNKENNLINESSPYLLQHAKNPVNWNPWDKKYLNIAEKQNKLVTYLKKEKQQLRKILKRLYKQEKLMVPL